MQHYRVIFFPALEKTDKSYEHPCVSLDQAKQVQSALEGAISDLQQQKLMDSFTNKTVIEQFVAGEWKDVKELM
jgi:hypothetical protein